MARLASLASAFWCVLALVACDGGDAPDAGAARDAGGADAAPLDAASVDAALDGAVPADAALDAFVPPPPCTWDELRPPPSGAVLWNDVLNRTGADTLGGHGHDDGRGPLGFCAGTPVAGQPFYRLLAVGFETDADVTGDGDNGDALPVDFWRTGHPGVGESAGRINVYIEVVDEAGIVLDRVSHPEIRYEREIRGGPTEAFGLDDKPDNEFQTNFPMSGGAVFGVQMEGASDRVLNLRLPVNHHVTFALVFRREVG